MILKIDFEGKKKERKKKYVNRGKGTSRLNFLVNTVKRQKIQLNIP